MAYATSPIGYEPRATLCPHCRLPAPTGRNYHGYCWKQLNAAIEREEQKQLGRLVGAAVWEAVK